MVQTVAQLGARVLRKLGISLVPNGSRPIDGATLSSDDMVTQVLQTLGIVVPASSRPSLQPPVGADEIAKRVMRAVGLNQIGVVLGIGTGTNYAQEEIAKAALTKLGVIAADEVPTAFDLTLADGRVSNVHDMLVGMDLVSGPVGIVPGALAEQYIIMTANLLAPAFGKPGNLEAFNSAILMIKQIALSGVKGQALALAKVQAVHDSLNAQSLVSWPLSAVPASFAEDYVAMAAALMAPVVGFQQDAGSRQISKAMSEEAEGRIRKAGMIANMQSRAADRVRGVQAELNAEGLVTWDADHVPAALADAIASMVVQQMPEYGKQDDPKAYALAEERVWRVSMGGPAGQVLAEQKIRAVHASLEARGHARWTLWDIPQWAEEPYVFMAAVWVAPEFARAGVKADPTWWVAAETDLFRTIELPAAEQTIVGQFF